MAHLGDRARRAARHFFSPLSFGSVQVRQHSQRLAGGRPGPRGFLAGRAPDSSPARACLVAAGIVGGQCGHWVWGSRARASVQYVGANAQRGVALRAFRLNCPRRPLPLGKTKLRWGEGGENYLRVEASKCFWARLLLHRERAFPAPFLIFPLAAWGHGILPPGRCKITFKHKVVRAASHLRRSESRSELKQGFFPYLRLLVTALGKVR